MAQTTAESAPHERTPRRATAPLAGLAALAALGCAVTLGTAPADARGALAWYTVLAAVALGATAAVGLTRLNTARRQLDAAERARAAADRRSAALAAELDAVQRDALALTDRLLPSAVARLRDRASAQTVLDGTDKPAHPALRRLLESTVEVLYQERRTLTAAMAVLQESAYRVQAAVTDQLAEIQQRKTQYWQDTGMVPRVGVRADFEALDARLAHMGLLTQRLMTLTGARRTGRQWPQPVVLERVLRAAVGSSEDYGRVELLLPAQPLSVSSAAVNPAIHVLAELVDNALRFSSPATVVRVTVEDVPAGVVIHIDDSGLLMSEETLRRARRAVDPEEPMEITALSGNRLGLAAAGASARRFGFVISFGRSPSQGTRATVWIPQKWLTTTVPAEPAAMAPASPTAPPASTADDTPGTATGTAPGGTARDAAGDTARTTGPAGPAGDAHDADDADLLPKRRPGATIRPEDAPPAPAASAAPAARSGQSGQSGPAAPSGRAPSRSPQETEHRMSGFRAAVRRTDAADDHSETSR